MADFRKLIVWQKSRLLVTRVYQITARFPKSEMFGLSDQMRRAAVSVISNIAEGYGRQSDMEFSHFLHIARGSLFELRSQLYVAEDLSYISAVENEDTQALTEEIGRMIAKLIMLLKVKS